MPEESQKRAVDSSRGIRGGINNKSPGETPGLFTTIPSTLTFLISERAVTAEPKNDCRPFGQHPAMIISSQ